jgi:protein TonB
VPASHDLTPHDPALVHPSAPAPAAVAAPEVTTAPVTDSDAARPRFVLRVAAVARSAGGSTQALPTASAASHAEGAEVADEGSVERPAHVLSAPTPVYPTEAREAGIEADVPLEIVVDASGRVLRAHVLQHAGYGLDAAAEKGVLAYRFSPALRHGRPTAVRMKWRMQFRLQ